MRVSYSVSYEAFVALQPPFTPIEPVGYGLFFFFEWVVAITGIGFVLVIVRIAYLLGLTSWPSADLLKGVAILALGGLPLLGVLIARRVSARSARRNHEEFLRASYSRLHCRDQRFVEIKEEGLVFGCACKTALKPWSQLTVLVESPASFIVAARSETQIIPKVAFPTEGDRTEFRALFSEKLNQDKTLNARTIEFVCSRADWNSVEWLRFKAGGWLRLMILALGVCIGVAMILFFGPIFDENARVAPPFIAAACAFAVIVVSLILLFRRRPARYLGPLKISFAEDAIYVQSPVSESRIPWQFVTGCVGDKRSLILLYRPSSVLLLPLRFVPSTQSRYILELLKAKLLRQ